MLSEIKTTQKEKELINGLNAFSLRISQPWIHWLTFKGQHAENTLVYTSKRFATDKAFEGFHAKRELANRQRAFSPERTLP